MSMNVNSAYNMQMQEATYKNDFATKNASKKEKTKESSNVKDSSNIAQKNESKLSEKAQNYLNDLRKKYDDYDFFIGNSTDELRELSKCGSKEFSVIFSKDEIERMATDEKYAAEKMQGVEGAVNMCRKICEEQGYVSAFDAFNAGNGTVNVIAKAMKEYNAGLEERQAKSLAKSNVVDNDYGELSKYYGKSQIIDQSLAEELNKLKDEISRLTGRKFSKTVAGEAPGTISSATNRELINTIKDTFSNVNFDDENEVNSAMKKYRELMRPAYKAGGYIERDDNALYYDTDSFTKMIKNLKLSLNFAHVDYSV